MAQTSGIVRILNSPHGKKYTSLKRALMYHADGRAHYDRESNTLLFRDRAIVIAERQRSNETVNGKSGWPWVQAESGIKECTGYGEGLGMQVMQMLVPQNRNRYRHERDQSSGS